MPFGPPLRGRHAKPLHRGHREHRGELYALRAHPAGNPESLDTRPRHSPFVIPGPDRGSRSGRSELLDSRLLPAGMTTDVDQELHRFGPDARWGRRSDDTERGVSRQGITTLLIRAQSPLLSMEESRRPRSRHQVRSREDHIASQRIIMNFPTKFSPVALSVTVYR